MTPLGSYKKENGLPGLTRWDRATCEQAMIHFRIIKMKDIPHTTVMEMQRLLKLMDEQDMKKLTDKLDQTSSDKSTRPTKSSAQPSAPEQPEEPPQRRKVLQAVNYLLEQDPMLLDSIAMEIVGRAQMQQGQMLPKDFRQVALLEAAYHIQNSGNNGPTPMTPTPPMAASSSASASASTKKDERMDRRSDRNDPEESYEDMGTSATRTKGSKKQDEFGW